MIPRVLEPEVMESAREAVDYDAMDHREVNRLFVADFLQVVEGGLPDSNAVRVLDVGTGTAQIPVELCRQQPEWEVVAVDLSQEMLKVGQGNVASAGFSHRIHLEWLDAKALPFADGEFAAVMSNSIIHHVPEPRPVLAEMVRVLSPGGVLFVRDLLRPSDARRLDHLVETYAGRENAHQRQMFRDSLHAALTVEEVRELLAGLSLPEAWIRQTSDRHWTLAGRLAGQKGSLGTA